MIKRIAIINKSTVLSNSDALKMTSACSIQISRDVSQPWGKIPLQVIFYTDERLVPSGSAKIYIFNNSDQVGALGYHSETTGGQVFGKIFVKTIIDYGCPILYDPRQKNQITVSSVLSHEVIEVFCNMFVDLWADGSPITEGSEYALEACDPVEANIYQILVPTIPSSMVSVSNFVYPEYFDTATPIGTKIDFMGLLRIPFTMTDYGYLIVRNGPGTETSIYGSKYPEFLKSIV